MGWPCGGRTLTSPLSCRSTGDSRGEQNMGGSLDDKSQMCEAALCYHFGSGPQLWNRTHEPLHCKVALLGVLRARGLITLCQPLLLSSKRQCHLHREGSTLRRVMSSLTPPSHLGYPVYRKADSCWLLSHGILTCNTILHCVTQAGLKFTIKYI